MHESGIQMRENTIGEWSHEETAKYDALTPEMISAGSKSKG
jgi:hypothetical protein